MAKLLTVALIIIAGFPAIVRPQRAASASIRKVDFANFHYVGSIGHFRADAYSSQAFTLHKGEFGDSSDGMSLRKVVYGDVTGDGAEEAIITFTVKSDGSAGVDHVYIYTLKNRRPAFLWGFEGGDRAEGGLRQAYARNGELVIELFGRGTSIGGYIGNTEQVGLCCPKSFTRTPYRFRKGRFVKNGRMEILPNPEAATSCPTCMPGSSASIDSVVEFLLTSAATDFHTHRPPDPVKFRDVRIGHVMTPSGPEQYMLCGQFLPSREGGKAEWTPFVTIKTSGYEQYIGATHYCQGPAVKWDDVGDLSSALQRRLDSLR